MLKMLGTDRTFSPCKKIMALLLTSQVLLMCVLYSQYDTDWARRTTYRISNSTQRHTVGHVQTMHWDPVQSPCIQNKTKNIISGQPQLKWVSSRVSDSNNQTTIAIGMGITTKKLKASKGVWSTMPFFKSMLPSFCQTCSPGFSYNFFLAYDFNDAFMKENNFVSNFSDVFLSFTAVHCDNRSTYRVHYVKCNHTKKPAWAQNDAMIVAYLYGIEYFYRINDDTIMKTSGWTETYITTLKKMDPPLVGVVGPRHRGGNVGILTYDFTHRTHIDIHGFYYPRIFTDWYADSWITKAYSPDRSKKLSQIRLVHTMEAGTRYRRSLSPGKKLPSEVVKAKYYIQKYVDALKRTCSVSSDKKVISMLVNLNDPNSTWGAVRNAQLTPVFYPGWTPRVYVKNNYETSSSLFETGDDLNTKNVLKLLHDLGAQIIFTNKSTVSSGPSVIGCHYLVADDPAVDAFLIRDPRSRLGEREATSVSEWMNQTDKPKAVHCLKDDKQHTKHNIVDGLWGAKTKPLRSLLHGKTMYDLLTDFRNKTQPNKIANENFVQTFVDEVLWKNIEADTSICDRSATMNVTFMAAQTSSNITYTPPLGQIVDAHETPISNN